MSSITASKARLVPAQRSRRRAQGEPMAPLGSLTQRSEHAQACCNECGGTQVTRLQMRLTDGTEVMFTSCHRCEARRWDAEGVELSMESVLARTRKTA
jgi:DNA-directed RNA polymerase subunit M/transcription elongation factor TFIIS